MEIAGQTTATATGLTPGSYTVTITDDNGCQRASTGPVTITEPDVLSIGSMSMDSVSCNGLSDELLLLMELLVGNGTNTFFMDWSQHNQSGRLVLCSW